MHDDQRICPVKYQKLYTTHLENNVAKIRFSANKNWLQDSKISLVFEPKFQILITMVVTITVFWGGTPA